MSTHLTTKHYFEVYGNKISDDNESQSSNQSSQNRQLVQPKVTELCKHNSVPYEREGVNSVKR